MNQENNDIEKKLIKQQDDYLKTRIKDDPQFYLTVKVMLLDYVVNNMTLQDIATKNNYPFSLVKKIATKFSFYTKKKEYEDKLLKTVLNKTQKKQAQLIATITEAISIQVRRIVKKQMEDENYIISNNNMKDLLSSLTIFSKEHRLDNDKPTDNNAVQVLVSFANDVPIVTENHLNKNNVIDVTEENSSEVTQEVQDKKEETIEEDKEEDSEEESLSNSDLFGILE